LKRLLETIAVATNGLRARRDCRHDAHTARRGRPLVTRCYAVEELRHRDVVHGQGAPTALEAGQIEEIADDALEARRLVCNDAQIARASLFVDREIGHREGFEIAAHRGDRCRQLVRHVCEQLTAHTV
jgi:hypothetical protein